MLDIPKIVKYLEILTKKNFEAKIFDECFKSTKEKLFQIKKGRKPQKSC